MKLPRLAVVTAAVLVLTIMAFSPASSHAGALEEGRAAIGQEDYEAALRLLMPLAEQGNPVAQNAIGVLYQNGWGLKQDHAEALKLFRKAAEQGEPKSHFNLGKMYEKGWGVARNCSEAKRWYLAPAKRGDPVGQAMLANLYYEGGDCIEKDFIEASRWYGKAAEQGDPIGQTNLGYMYFAGEGVKQDFAEAARWYRKAAEQGDAVAQTNLGKMYFAGQGVEQDFAEALKWYRKAAALGGVQAQFSLGMMFELGLGVEQDKTEALKWYRLAADQGDPAAMERARALTPTAAPGALRVPSLDEALAASAVDLAKGLFFTRQVIRTLLPFVEKTGATLRTGLIPGLEIDRDTVQVARSVLEARLAIYETAARQRGYKDISGRYRAKATSSCARSNSMWAMGAARSRDLKIKQDGFDILIGHGSAFEAPGVVVESVLVFTDPRNTDYPFTGKIDATRLTIRPDVDTVRAAWPGWAGPPSRKDLEDCEIRLVAK